MRLETLQNVISIIVSVGVESLSAVLPAVRRLTYANH